MWEKTGRVTMTKLRVRLITSGHVKLKFPISSRVWRGTGVSKDYGPFTDLNVATESI